MKALLMILQLAYLLAGLYFAGGAIRFFTGSESFLINMLVWMAMFVIMMLPGGVLLILGCLSYYLYVGEEWNAFAIIAFVFPGFVLSIVGASLEAISSFFKK